jgi:hypothetical protein
MRDYIIRSNDTKQYIFRSHDMRIAAAELVRLQSNGIACTAVAKTKGVRSNQLQGCGAEFHEIVNEIRAAQAAR